MLINTVVLELAFTILIQHGQRISVNNWLFDEIKLVQNAIENRIKHEL